MGNIGTIGKLALADVIGYVLCRLSGWNGKE
jgi:hypothetical protein